MTAHRTHRKVLRYRNTPEAPRFGTVRSSHRGTSLRAIYLGPLQVLVITRKVAR
ncbi:MAG: hypothetical protein ACXVGB_00270 [Mycobacteriaceae bacterium]